MKLATYLPSAQFASILVSIVVAGGVVYAAQYVTHGNVSAKISAGPAANNNVDWEATLSAIQAQNAASAIEPPDPNAVQNLLAAAESNNVTDTVGRTLFINLSNAKSQG